jgi:CBS domain-containing protein
VIARDVMTADPLTVTRDTPIGQAAELMRDRDISMLPVVDRDTGIWLRGIITDRDIVDRCVAEGHRSGCVVGDHWTSMGVETVRPDDSLDAIIVKLATSNVRRAPVVDASNRIVGVITRADLVRRGSRGDPVVRARILEQLSDVTAGH